MKVAAIDLGTNSFLCLVASVENGKLKTVHEDVTHLVRIGEKVHETRMLQPQALERAKNSFKEFQGIISKYECDRVLAVATSAARDVKNSSDLIRLGSDFGIPIEVISGEQEAYLTFTGMTVDRSDLSGVVGIDIGGGSTEIIRMDSSDRIIGKSVDVGCVRMTELFVKANPISSQDMENMTSYVREKLSVFSKMQLKEAIAVAGTPTALACVHKNIKFDADKVHGTKLSREVIRELTKRLSKLSVEDRLKIPGLDRGRADVIVAGGVVLDVVGDIIGVDEFTVSVLGARYGLALAMAKGKM